ncbi:hypothetical protein [Agromyces sp. M3QZ16-3]|uniref:hypothetical protein n=1 Tax=Agromyces sp. M3QZ16-3 TaxID=3447585 RepID=UPI003F68D925
MHGGEPIDATSERQDPVRGTLRRPADDRALATVAAATRSGVDGLGFFTSVIRRTLVEA